MIEPTYSKDLISNAAKSGVMTFTEINDNLQGVELSEEILEIFAELTQQTMEKANRRSYEAGGFDLKYLPAYSHNIAIMQAHDKQKIGIVVYTIDAKTSDGPQTTYQTMIFRISGNRLNKIICNNVRNLFESEDCVNAVNQIF